MKPGRLQNALKSLGRASKCFKTLLAGLQNPWNSWKCRLGGSQKLQNPRKSQKWYFFRHQIVPNSITGMERSILNTLWKKMKRFCSQVSSSGWHFWIGPVLEAGEQSSFGKLAKNSTNIKNTWKSRKLKKSIKIKGNK